MVSPVVHITTERGMSGESGVHNSFEMRVAVARIFFFFLFFCLLQMNSVNIIFNIIVLIMNFCVT